MVPVSASVIRRTYITNFDSDGVWWSNFTLLTIGIGDFSPTTHLGKSLLFPFAIGGIVILGLVIGSIRSLVLERGEKKIAARMVEKKREKVVSQMDGDVEEQKIKISPIFRNIRLKREGKSEYQRRGEEFRLMRRIQQYAETRRKWTTLMISVLSWLALWLLGAVVFWVAERNVQPVTYFDEVYFAYTSLLTIGYGDYTMESNVGKPIFVFWSLLAIPTLTILISNMGDTVVKGVRDATLWLGELTVLPGEGSTLHKFKEGARIVKERRVHGDTNDLVEEPAGGVSMPESDRRAGHENSSKTPRSANEAALQRLGEDLEEEELGEAEDAKERGDKLSEDVHLYHYLLVKELRNVMKDVNETPPKKYSYHEWAWFLRLLGEDENDPKFHRAPTESTDANEIQQADKSVDGKSSSWSWVGIKSPLLGETDEAPWVLERLGEKLESELRQRRQQMKSGKNVQEPPPVTKGSRDEQEEPSPDTNRESKDV